MLDSRHRRHGGQTIALFALALVGIVLMVGLVIDGGYAFAQRRVAQNAADFAAIAGSRVVAQRLTGDTTNGTDANVQQAIEAALSANGAKVTDTSTSPATKLYTARYVDQTGSVVGDVGSPSGSIPTTALGVVVDASKSWAPFFLGVIGVSSWSAGANAVAMSPGVNLGTGILPFGVSDATITRNDACAVGNDAGSANPGCTPFHLSPGSLNVPGGFAWLKFGCYQRTDSNNKHYGLGQVLPAAAGGCSNSKPFLDGEWGSLPTTPGDTYGCCTSVSASTAAGFGNDIGSLPGNKASVNDGQPTINYLETNHIAGWVPVWDSANGNGSNGYYHIIGYAAFEITHITGGKDIEGVLRVKDLSNNPTQVVDAPDASALIIYNGTVQLIR